MHFGVLPLPSPSTDFYILENATASVNTVVGVVGATDADGNYIFYKGGSTSLPVFVMFDNKLVFFNGQLDYETEPK